jgi:hypothetical protein
VGSGGKLGVAEFLKVQGEPPVIDWDVCLSGRNVGATLRCGEVGVVDGQHFLEPAAVRDGLASATARPK